MIAPIVQNLLVSNPAIVTAVADRIHYVERPQSVTVPALVIQYGSGIPDHNMKGPTGTVRGMVRVTSLASTYLGAHDLAKLVRNALDGYTGTVMDMHVSYLFLNNESDIPSDHRNGQGSILTHGIQQDFNYQFTTTPE